MWDRYITSDKTTKAEDFHKHLDKCKQCRDNPFNLCPIGAKLIQEVVK